MKLLELTHTHGCVFEQMDLRHGRIQAQFADRDDQGSPPVRFERRQYHVIVIGYFRAGLQIVSDILRVLVQVPTRYSIAHILSYNIFDL